MTSNQRQLEPLSFPKINVNPTMNYKSNDSNINNNIRVKRPGNFSSTASIFFNQNKKIKNLGSVNIKESTKLKKIKKPEKQEPIDEEEIDPKDKNIPQNDSAGNNAAGTNNDSFINELEVLLTNVNPKEQDDDAHSVDEDTPDPRINFEHINDINKYRPQTSYGGLNQRRHKLQIALRSATNKEKNKIKCGTQLNFMQHPFDNSPKDGEY
mgnify:CR=1 FL=1